MSGNTPQRTTFRPPWVKDGPNPVPTASVPWRTKDKTAAVSTADDQPNAVFLRNFIFGINHDAINTNAT